MTAEDDSKVVGQLRRLDHSWTSSKKVTIFFFLPLLFYFPTHYLLYTFVGHVSLGLLRDSGMRK